MMNNIPAFTHHVGSTERAFVAHVNDLNDFYLNSESIHQSLVNLGKDLYNEYSQSYTKSSGNEDKLHVGDYCACPSESEDWYRGLIREIDSNGHAIVFKIDYGDVQCIPMQFLRPLKERFFKLNRLAFHCSLVNLIKPTDGWSNDVVEEFRSRVTTTFLYAKFINYNEIRDISEVEITEKTSKIPLHKDFEKYQLPRSTTSMNDKLLYKHIPMEILDSTQPNQIRLLYYISPGRFYVYLQEKADSHLSFQADLQKEAQNLSPLLSPRRYQSIAAQDNHAVWHRATVLNIHQDSSMISVFFMDIGQRDRIPLNRIRELPEEFQYKPAFAIPCQLNHVCPLNGNDPTMWKAIDAVHDEFNRLMVNTETCHMREKHDQLYYTIEIDIPKLGDLSKFLIDNNFVSRTNMRNLQRPAFSSGQGSNQSFVRATLNASGASIRPLQQRSGQGNDSFQSSNYTPQQQTSRMPTNGQQAFIPQSSSNKSATGANALPSPFPVFSPQNGYYKIIQVHSATEFYGLSQKRENEFASLCQHLANYYNNAAMDPSFGATIFFDNKLYVIQNDNRYYRVLMIRRESETRVCVKLIDRGDEIFVDTSELLNIEPSSSTIAAFAQPFRLHGFDESKNSANITLNLKKMILNQNVSITLQGPVINGFYPVEVQINDRSINQMLLSNDRNPPMTLVSATNQPPATAPAHVETQVFSNSHRYFDSSGGRSDTRPRADDGLPPPQKILTGPPRSQMGRFTSGPNSTAPSNEPPPRVSSFANRNQQTQPTNSSWISDQNNKPNNNSTGFSNQSTFNRQQSNPSQSNNNQRTDENQPSGFSNASRFPSNNPAERQQSFEQKRSYGGGYGQDDRNDRQTSGNNDSGFQKGSFSNRGGSNGDRGGRGGYNDHNMNRNNQGNNNGHSSDGTFRPRGGGFADRGGRGGSSYDNNYNRNTGDDRGRGFQGDRGGRGGRGGGGGGGRDGGFPNRRDQQGDNSGFERRNDRGGSRGGFRGNSNRSNFQNRDHNDIQLSSDTSTKSFSGWPNTQSSAATAPFEEADRFVDSSIPSQEFKYVVSHIETANLFYIQLLSKGDELYALSERLQTEYKQSPDVNISSFRVNQPCLAKFSDDCWYRAIVLSTGLTQLKVRFVDFGNTTEVDSKSIRQISKKQSTTPPYAYQCTFENVQVVDNVNNIIIINACAGKEFQGKIVSKTSDGKFILQSKELLDVLQKINAIKVKAENNLKRIKCLIGHIESDQREFYIQDDENTLNEIIELISEEEPNAHTLSLDEVKDLSPNTIVIARYEDEPFRGVIQSNESDNDVNIRFVDYGNVSSCPKNSLKRSSEKLSSFPSQAKHCRLYGISSDKIDQALTYLGDNTDAENLQVSIVKEKDQIHDLLVYINNKCLNEKFGYDPNKEETEAAVQEQLSTELKPVVRSTEPEEEQPSTEPEPAVRSTESKEEQPTTEREQQQELPTESKQHTTEDATALNEDVVSKDETPAVPPSEIDESSSKYIHGVLSHVETSKPYVYIQLTPEVLDQIIELIGKVVEEDQRKTSYEIGEYVVAKFSVDGDYYRARIDRYCSTSQMYTVYFLDYGNIDENVSIENIYSYTDDLKQIDPQAHGYLLERIDSETWNTTVRPLLEELINVDVEFYYTDDNHSTIHMKFENEDDIYNVDHTFTAIEQDTTFQANISSTENDCFYIHVVPEGNLHVCELEEVLLTCPKERKDSSWSINDRCLVSTEDKKYFRGEILAINDDKYNVKCIDYGKHLLNISADDLYALPDDEIFQQSSLAHQCRLYGMNDEEQSKYMQEILPTIPASEHVNITIENDPNDPCWLVTLVRENHQCNGNEQKETNVEENKLESDKEESQEIIPPIPDESCEKLDSTNAIDQSSLLSITNNQTIDFGENDPSTTIKDDTNTSFASN